jgi:release factor glutamine methyltransferase
MATTVGQALHDAASRLAPISDDARLEAEVLLGHALGIDRSTLLARMPDDVDGAVAGAFLALLARRVGREPLAYIVGQREFYGKEIACGPGALIPRPETELLVEVALAELRRRRGDVQVADVGAGSGAVAVAVAAHAANARVTAIERSAAAIELARRNIERHGLAGRVTLVQGDLLEGARTFDLIVANLPYVSEVEWGELAPEIRDHEPRDAVVGGPIGSEVIERLLVQAPAHVARDGLVAVEIGATQARRVVDCARTAFPEGRASVMKDFAGRDRVVCVHM